MADMSVVVIGSPLSKLTGKIWALRRGISTIVAGGSMGPGLADDEDGVDEGIPGRPPNRPAPGRPPNRPAPGRPPNELLDEANRVTDGMERICDELELANCLRSDDELPKLNKAELLELPKGDGSAAWLTRALDAELLEEPIVVGAVMAAADELDEPNCVMRAAEELEEPIVVGAVMAAAELLDEPNGATKAAELLDEPTPNTLVNVIFAIGVPVLLNLAYRLPLLTNPNSSYPK